MANKRLISRDVVCTDKFHKLHASSKVLYMYLVLAADDDGFVDQVTAVRRQCKVKMASLQELIESDYVLMFADDLLVIRHWIAMNKMPPSKRRETRYQGILAGLKANKYGFYEVVTKTAQ